MIYITILRNSLRIVEFCFTGIDCLFLVLLLFEMYYWSYCSRQLDFIIWIKTKLFLLLRDQICVSFLDLDFGNLDIRCLYNQMEPLSYSDRQICFWCCFYLDIFVILVVLGDLIEVEGKMSGRREAYALSHDVKIDGQRRRISSL